MAFHARLVGILNFVCTMNISRMKCVSALLAASLFGVVFGVEPSVSDLSNLATVGRVDSEAGGELVGGFVVEGGEGLSLIHI